MTKNYKSKTFSFHRHIFLVWEKKNIAARGVSVELFKAIDHVLSIKKPVQIERYKAKQHTSIWSRDTCSCENENQGHADSCFKNNQRMPCLTFPRSRLITGLQCFAN
jgi:hypothetical protein